MEKEKKNNNLVVIILFVFLMISLVLGAVGLMNRKEKPNDNTPTPVEPADGGEEEGGEYAPIVDDYTTMLTNIINIYNAAEQQWLLDSATESIDKAYSFCKVGVCENNLTLENNEIEYYILFNKEGNVTKYYATNDKYQYKYEGNKLTIEDINSLDTVADLPEEEVIHIVPNM